MNYPNVIQEFLEKYDRLFLDSFGIIKLQPADFYKTLDYTDLRVWCICRAIYQLPTIELVESDYMEGFSLLKEGLPEKAIALTTTTIDPH